MKASVPPSASLNAPLIPSSINGGTPTCEACSMVGVGALDPLGPSFPPGRKGGPDGGPGGQPDSRLCTPRIGGG